MVRRRLARSILPLAALASTAGAPAGAAQEPPLGRASAIVEEPASETVLLPAGSVLRGAPSAHAGRLTVIDFEVELPILERRGAWVQVDFAGERGWIALVPIGDDNAPAEPAGPPVEDPLHRIRRVAASVERIERARALLGAGASRHRLGPFTLHTAVDKIALVDRLRRVASALPDTYAARTGLVPEPESGFAVILFASEDEYRRYEEADQLSALGLEGHAVGGVAALYLGRRHFGALQPVAVHELTHLLNRTTLGDRAPAWLEEGIANDLAYCRADGSGRLQLGTLAGTELVTQERGRRETLHLEGPIASLSFLKTADYRNRLVPLPTLLDLAWSEFVQLEDRDLRYVQSAFLVRFLLDGRGADGAEAFRDFLRGVAAGESGSPAGLLAALDSDWPALERGFRSWLALQSVRP